MAILCNGFIFYGFLGLLVSFFCFFLYCWELSRSSLGFMRFCFKGGEGVGISLTLVIFIGIEGI